MVGRISEVLSLEWNRDGVMHSESGDDELVRERRDDSDSSSTGWRSSLRSYSRDEQR